MTRRRVVFVGPHLGRHPGWVTTQGEILARLFDEAGHDVVETSSVRQPLLRLVDMVTSLVVWRRRVDVVVLSVFSGRAFYFADVVGRLCRRLRLPQIYVLRGGNLPELFADRPSWSRRVLGRADAIVAPSSYLERAVNDLGLPPGPLVSTIPNVLDLDRYRYSARQQIPAAPRILWMRTFHPVYHPELAIEALAELRSRGVDARLTMAGQAKGLLDDCRRLATDRGLGDYVDFPGFLDAEGKRDAFASHDVFWNTNRIDNTPVTVLEAMASGLPVVATAVGGVPDLLQMTIDPAGITVPAGDAAAMAAETAALIDDSDRVAHLSAAGRAVAEASAWPRVEARWLDLFDQLDVGSAE